MNRIQLWCVLQKKHKVFDLKGNQAIKSSPHSPQTSEHVLEGQRSKHHNIEGFAGTMLARTLGGTDQQGPRQAYHQADMLDPHKQPYFQADQTLNKAAFGHQGGPEQYHGAAFGNAVSATGERSGALTIIPHNPGISHLDQGEGFNPQALGPGASNPSEIDSFWPTMSGAYWTARHNTGRWQQYAVTGGVNATQLHLAGDSMQIVSLQDSRTERAVHGDALVPAHLQAMLLGQAPVSHGGIDAQHALWENPCWRPPSDPGTMHAESDGHHHPR
jgi:hypothetical protein